ncbi:hypothetical protein F4694_002587 [Bacillus niacini]|uniref:Uncharacterized protein n=1 Tax=Neobacillus niacini TaxID=86668 RepID=A0A852TAJ9_9BACI|nr:hypothetical protein [Neobacillus niacini]NYE05812.1 hypothetical protein [Neobacillus niacini]
MKISAMNIVQEDAHIFWDRASMAPQVMTRIEEELRAANLPVKAGLEKVSAGMLKGSKQFLVIEGPKKDVKILISAEGYGNFLHVFTYMLSEPSMFKQLGASLTAVASKNPGAAGLAYNLSQNPFDQQEYSMFWNSVTSVVDFSLHNLNLKKGFAGLEVPVGV